MDLGEAVVAAVSPHPAVEQVELVGSRAEGRATRWSDWDFAVRARDFAAVSRALPELLAPLHPLVEQWDRLSSERCWMLIVPGPTKVDLIFPDERQTKEPPWEPRRETLAGIDGHFWDWMLWLRSKEARGGNELIAGELRKLFDHLLAPLGADAPPSSIVEAVETYRAVRAGAECRLGATVPRGLEREVAPALER